MPVINKIACKNYNVFYIGRTGRELRTSNN